MVKLTQWRVWAASRMAPITCACVGKLFAWAIFWILLWHTAFDTLVGLFWILLWHTAFDTLVGLFWILLWHTAFDTLVGLFWILLLDTVFDTLVGLFWILLLHTALLACAFFLLIISLFLSPISLPPISLHSLHSPVTYACKPPHVGGAHRQMRERALKKVTERKYG
jgi:hypothetical protein